MYPPEVYKSYLTPLRFLQRSAAVFRAKVAIIHRDQRLTYPEFNSRVNRLASALRSSGIARGDRVAVLLPNIPPMLEAHFGIPAAGLVLVPSRAEDSVGPDHAPTGPSTWYVPLDGFTLCRRSAWTM